MAKSDWRSAEIIDREAGQDILLKTKPQPKPELDETLERLTKQVAKGGGIAFGGSVIGKVATFGLHILLGRVLGPGAYGLYALGVSVSSIVQSVAALGLPPGVVRFCAVYQGEGDDARVKGTILSALVISMISSLLLATLLFTFSDVIAQKFFQESDLTWVLRVFALALPFYVLIGITTSFAQSFRRIEYQQGVQNIFRPLVKLILVGIVFLLGFQLAGAVYGFLISGVLSAGLGGYFLLKIFPSIRSNLKPKYQVQKLLRFSVPLFLAGLAYILILQTDRIMLGYFHDAYNVGIYNAAAVIALQIGSITFAPLTIIMSPIMANLYNQNQDNELRSIFQTATRWMFTLGVPLFLITFYFAPEIMRWFGSEFASGWIILILLCLSQFIFVSVGPTGELLQMSGRQDLDLINTASLLLVNVGLNLWLIPLLGTIGAAIATGVSVALVNIAQFVEVRLLLKVNPYSSNFLKPLFIALGIAVLGIPVRYYVIRHANWMLGASFLLVSYLIAYYLWGLSREERLILTALKQRIIRSMRRWI